MQVGAAWCTCSLIIGTYLQGASAKTWRYIEMLVEQSQTFGKWYSLFILQWQLSLDQNKVKMNYLWVLNLLFKCFLLLIFWASGFCWCTLYIYERYKNICEAIQQTVLFTFLTVGWIDLFLLRTSSLLVVCHNEWEPMETEQDMGRTDEKWI